MYKEAIEMEDTTKKWYESRGVIGGVIVLAATVGGFFGYTVSAEEQNLLVELILALVTAAGGIVGICGRVRANKQIK
jgi:uncharacterized membrane protein